MVEAQRIRVDTTWKVMLTFTAQSDTFTTPATPTFGGPFGADMFAVIDLASFPIAEGLTFATNPKVELDIRKSPPPPAPPIVFKMNGRTARYSLDGYTSNWTLSYQTLDPPSGRPTLPGFPADVPLNLLPYVNWDHQIQTPSALTCAPQSAEQAAAVCNWARQNGYQVRPRGVMHGWSPLTLPTTPGVGAKVVLIDLTKSMHGLRFLPATDQLPNRVEAGAGATLLQLLGFLEAQPGGTGAAPGYSFPHAPAPGNLTVGGILAIDAHGTAVRTPHDDLPASYGSISNQVLAFTAICTDPSSTTPDDYVVRRFERGDPDVTALLVNLGRTLIVDATLHVVDNYNLRCESRTDVPASTLFAAPQPAQQVPPDSFADFFERSGRIEIIWFPFSDSPPAPLPPANPWLHIWTMAPQKPPASIAVAAPYNYPFADHVPDILQGFVKQILAGIPSVTPVFGWTTGHTTANGLEGKSAAGWPGTYPVSSDIWGPSKNTLLYIQDTTLRVTANGYAIHIARAGIQQAVADVTAKYRAMLADYAARGQYPINSPMEIRVTDLDDEAHVATPGGVSPGRPILSALSMDATDRANGWNVAIWFDILTIPGTPYADAFYHELERWILTRFSGTEGRTMPEWSKGWAYTEQDGAWTDGDFLQHVRRTLTDGRAPGDDWNFAVATLAKYDKSHLFSNPLLDRLFQPV